MAQLFPYATVSLGRPMAGWVRAPMQIIAPLYLHWMPITTHIIYIYNTAICIRVYINIYMCVTLYFMQYLYTTIDIDMYIHKICFFPKPSRPFATTLYRHHGASSTSG